MVLAIEELSALEDEIMSVLPDRITAGWKNFWNYSVWKIC